MNTTVTPEASFVIIPADVELAEETKLSIEHGFSEFFAKARDLIAQSEAIKTPKMARAARLEFKALRVAAEKARKRLKEDSVRYGKAVDGANHILLAAIVPHEERLEEIEKEEEKKEAARIFQLEADRRLELAPYAGANHGTLNLGLISEEDYQFLLADYKALHEVRVKREQEEEAVKLAKEVAEAKAREAVRIENERLKAELLAREEAAREAAEQAEALRLVQEEEDRIERARLEEQARIEREQAAAEKKALEDKLAAERAEATRKAKAEAMRVAAEKKAADEKAALDREIAAEKERALREAAEAERERARAAQAKLDAAEAKRLADEAAKIRAAEEAAEKAAQAPDKEKVISYIEALLVVPAPDVKSKKIGKFLTRGIAELQDILETLRIQVS